MTLFTRTTRLHNNIHVYGNTVSVSSYSFGQSAIFLLGGKTKQVRPKAMFLHSGDIIIMSNESRLDYHGVPRIVDTLSEPWRDQTLPEDFGSFNEYLKRSRININVRQVYVRWLMIHITQLNLVDIQNVWHFHAIKFWK